MKKISHIQLKNPYLTIILFLTFFIFTFIGAGNIIVVSFMGICLCLLGLLQGSVKVDLWIFMPLFLYNLISLISGYRIYGNTIIGFSSTQFIFPLIYLLVSYLQKNERYILQILCSLWVGIIAFLGIGEFVVEAFYGNASRISGLLGNPNAMGAILVMGWFSIKSCLFKIEDGSIFKRILNFFESIILIALSLTLSIGSFGALGIGVIVMSLYGKQSFLYLLGQLSTIILSFACGLLLYIAGSYTNWFGLVVVILIYICLFSWYREKLNKCLSKYSVLPIVLCLAGILGLGILVILRPNAFATLSERIAMIKDGFQYLWIHPILGIGPYQWRIYNLHSGGQYFNTWHIHNIFVHVAVELGIIAFFMLLMIVVRHFMKKEDMAQRGAFIATFVHNLMDTSFFYIATVPFLIMISHQDDHYTKSLNKFTTRIIFCLLLFLFSWNLMQCFL